jgi:hypothetical protein
MTCPREGTLEHNPGPAGGPAAAGPGKGGNGTCRWAFIGTLVKGVQVRHGAKGGKVTQIGGTPDFMPLVRCKCRSTDARALPGQIQNRPRIIILIIILRAISRPAVGLQGRAMV